VGSAGWTPRAIRAPHFRAAVLPGTVNRVKTPLSHRKQTTAHPLTRNVPAHRSFRRGFAQLNASHSAPSRELCGWRCARFEYKGGGMVRDLLFAVGRACHSEERRDEESLLAAVRETKRDSSGRKPPFRMTPVGVRGPLLTSAGRGRTALRLRSGQNVARRRLRCRNTVQTRAGADACERDRLPSSSCNRSTGR
jgi:hypothetical protein